MRGLTVADIPAAVEGLRLPLRQDPIGRTLLDETVQRLLARLRDAVAQHDLHRDQGVHDGHGRKNAATPAGTKNRTVNKSADCPSRSSGGAEKDHITSAPYVC
ncbi:hypothetical protein OG613_05410 [Streptomyces sp. NBC_00015]|uniref:hypothetical protein n=1 Tax=Streptomyces sp. NBC_00015 TaxID=2903611 RepID=UPI0032489460